MTNKKLEVIIMIGLPASGKSTFAKLNYPSHGLISLDEMKHNRKREEEFIEENLSKGTSLIISDTNLTHKIRTKHISIAKKYNAYTTAVFLNLPVDFILQRNRNREKPVPEASIYRMRKKLELPSYDEGFGKIRIITSPEDVVGREPRKHVIFTDGVVKKEGNFIAWIDDTTKDEFAYRSQGEDIVRCEYLAIIHALQNNKTLQYGDEVDIRCDDESVVRQLNGGYKVIEEDLRWYVRSIHTIAKNYAKVSCTWISTRENKVDLY